MAMVSQVANVEVTVTASDQRHRRSEGRRGRSGEEAETRLSLRSMSGSQMIWLAVLLALTLVPALFLGRSAWRTFVRNEHGDLVEVRASDGVHFTPSGYMFLGRLAIRAADQAFGMPDKAVTSRS